MEAYSSLPNNVDEILFETIPEENQGTFVLIANLIRDYIDQPEAIVYARGSRTTTNYSENSDYDVSLVFPEWWGGFNAVELEEHLTKKLNKKVDVWVYKFIKTNIPKIPFE